MTPIISSAAADDDDIQILTDDKTTIRCNNHQNNSNRDGEMREVPSSKSSRSGLLENSRSGDVTTTGSYDSRSSRKSGDRHDMMYDNEYSRDSRDHVGHHSDNRDGGIRYGRYDSPPVGSRREEPLKSSSSLSGRRGYNV